ncbi:hypothetical protein M501DRAFT_1020756 [Patellaria atrata CBS 101060]|uniref:Uncharacterized protein n=1 Tax=Patellaria atrata CBS 101060 TaxID=1346257 RepID=A0A9P4S1G7_9PEZI|nr:hypothetical protein M501DRAFT_1020756 [Patellaria atrata CBS 101060]
MASLRELFIAICLLPSLSLVTTLPIPDYIPEPDDPGPPPPGTPPEVLPAYEGPIPGGRPSNPPHFRVWIAAINGVEAQYVTASEDEQCLDDSHFSSGASSATSCDDSNGNVGMPAGTIINGKKVPIPGIPWNAPAKSLKGRRWVRDGGFKRHDSFDPSEGPELTEAQRIELKMLESRGWHFDDDTESETEMGR